MGSVRTPSQLQEPLDSLVTGSFEDLKHAKVAVRPLIIDSLGLYYNVVFIATVPSPTQVGKKLGMFATLGCFHILEGMSSELHEGNDLIGVGNLLLVLTEPTICRTVQEAWTVGTERRHLSQRATQHLTPTGYILVGLLQ